MAEQAEVNRRVWSSREVTSEYGRRTQIWEVERRIFEANAPYLRDKRVLDIGCGTGRTTAELLKYTSRYVGVDYSPGMLAEFRKRFPGVRVLQCDMREMSVFGKAAFDFALCSFNGLDYVSHDDRLRALREVRRVLCAGGLFAFSAHNRNYAGATAAPRPAWSRHPRQLARALLDFALEVHNHRRNRRRQTFAPQYAVINDCAHHYSLLTYYIDRRQQAGQLAAAGFELLDAYDRTGVVLGADASDARSSFIYYVARKAGTEPE